MAWVRIPPLPRSFVSPRRRLLFAAGSRPAGRGTSEHHLAELRAALRAAPLTAALWLRNAGGEAESGARHASSRALTAPRSRPSVSPGSAPPPARPFPYSAPGCSLPASRGKGRRSVGVLRGGTAQPWETWQRGAAGRHRTGFAELHVPFYFPSYAVTRSVHKGNSHRVSSVQPTGAIHSRERSACFLRTFLSSPLLRCLHLLSAAFLRRLCPVFFSQLLVHSSSQFGNMCDFKRVLVMDFGCNCLQCWWCSGLFCF